VADTDNHVDAMIATASQVNTRADRLNLTPTDIGVLISYIAGAAPDTLHLALDYIEKHRPKPATTIAADFGPQQFGTAPGPDGDTREWDQDGQP
jgi:hypothetical protein